MMANKVRSCHEELISTHTGICMMKTSGISSDGADPDCVDGKSTVTFP